ncbi:MAG: GlmU family protein [Cytophagales bacterium]|nr:GlmU family protein [Cytophagales bacterium]
MTNIILFDEPQARQNLLPFTFTRPVASLRCGILTIKEKWEKRFSLEASYLTQDYLQKKFPLRFQDEDNVLVNGSVLPDDEMAAAVQKLQENQALVKSGLVLAFRASRKVAQNFDLSSLPEGVEPQEYAGEPNLLLNSWDIYRKNGEQIRLDFPLVTNGRQSESIDDKYTRVYGEENIFIEEGANIKAATLNAENGPIYIGKGAQIEEGAMVQGPLALCEGAKIHMGAKIRPDSTFGPFCKAGGEISNAVMQAYSNKGHDGFLGNSVLGEWCNLGADTNTSNLKNNYAEARVWNYAKEGFARTGTQFCGLLMGDHSKAGINTMFNTGTVVGVGAIIYGSDFPRNFIPSFSWGGHAGFITHRMNKFSETARLVVARRGKVWDDMEEQIIDRVFRDTQKFRVWEK